MGFISAVWGCTCPTGSVPRKPSHWPRFGLDLPRWCWQMHGRWLYVQTNINHVQYRARFDACTLQCAVRGQGDLKLGAARATSVAQQEAPARPSWTTAGGDEWARRAIPPDLSQHDVPCTGGRSLL